MRTLMRNAMAVGAVGAVMCLAVACSDASPTAPSSAVVATASFGKNPGAGPGTVGGGGGGGGGAANCGQPLVTFSHGAQFSRGCSQLFGCGYFPINAAARALAPKGLDANCNIIV